MANYDVLTFETLLAQAEALILSYCKNYYNYEDIPEALRKVGYKKTVKVQGGAGQHYKHSITGIATIVDSTRITQVTSDTIIREFRNYMITAKKIKTTDQVTTNRLAYFLNCLTAFIQTKLRIAGTDTYINSTLVPIYLSSSTAFPNVSDFRDYENDASYDVKPFENGNPPDTETKFTVDAKEVVRASDVNQVLDILNKVLHKNVKPYVVKYSYTQTTD